MSGNLRSVRGMHDLLPDDLVLWHRLESVVRETLGSYGFQEIRVPILEKTEVFQRAIGEATDVVEKEMYTFDDRNGDSLSLRPEGTAGVVRAALQNGLLYGAPQRLWYAGPMFRHERPQKGRLRQFHQVGAEMFGSPGADVDAELLAMGERIWRRLGLKDIRLELNSLGTSEDRLAFRKRLVAFLESHQAALDDETRERARRNPLRVLDSKNPDVQALLEDAPVLSDCLGEESQAHFDALRSALDRMNIDYVVNPRLVRGLDYYCHSVFEWVTTDLGAQGTICAGGRYDGLVEIQGGKPWPATGFAMGLERLVELMKLAGEPEAARADLYLVLAGDAAQEAGFVIAEAVRDACPALRLVRNPGGGSFKSQFKRADRSGARLALVVAEDELKAGTVTVKFLREDRSQETVSQEGLGDWLRAVWQD